MVLTVIGDVPFQVAIHHAQSIGMATIFKVNNRSDVNLPGDVAHIFEVFGGCIDVFKIRQRIFPTLLSQEGHIGSKLCP